MTRIEKEKVIIPLIAILLMTTIRQMFMILMTTCSRTLLKKKVYRNLYQTKKSCTINSWSIFITGKRNWQERNTTNEIQN